jgi:hypothetical protein
MHGVSVMVKETPELIAVTLNKMEMGLEKTITNQPIDTTWRLPFTRTMYKTGNFASCFYVPIDSIPKWRPRDDQIHRLEIKAVWQRKVRSMAYWSR